MNETKIEWCTKSLNPVVGCAFNCEYCYARKLNHRFKYIEDWNKPKFYPERLKQLSMKKPQNIFMNSMSDIADGKEEWLNEIYEAIKNNPQHNYMFLTKRMYDIYYGADRFSDLFDMPNVWLGITATKTVDLIDDLQALVSFKNLKCKVFISIEPIHEFIDVSKYTVYFKKLDWVIVGAETGNRKGKIIPKNYFVNDIIFYSKFNCDIPLFYKESMKSVVGENYMFREFPKELRSD